MYNTSIVQGNNYRFTVLTDSLIRIEYSQSGNFTDDNTQVVQNRNFPSVNFDVIKNIDELQIITDKLHLYYKYGEFSGSTFFIEMKSALSDFKNRWAFGEVVETLKGTTKTLDGIDGAVELGDGIISRGGYAILDDSLSWIEKEDGSFSARNAGDIDIYFFGYRHDYLRALQDYYRLAGPTPLIPRFALGNWWSRFWPYTEETYIELMENFMRKGIPVAVSVIDMDWHIRDIPERFGSGWTGYSWNNDYFPEPSRFLERLHQMGLKVSLNVHPADGVRAFEDAYPKISSRLKLNVLLEEPALFDFNNSEFRDGYFEDVHHPLEKQGVDFWWVDWQQGEHSKTQGLDPLWALNYYHFKDHQYRQKDEIILSRYAGPGSHRYPVGFSGDSVISWDSLAFQPYFTATASNIGYSWWSHDIGGHMQGYHNEELTLRWLQFGIFSPINRLHSSASPFNSKDPSCYSPEIEQAMVEALRLRHAFIPYLYTMNVRNHQEGIPLMLPMYYYDSESEDAYSVMNEYLFGSELIVAPITEHTDLQLKMAPCDIWLPEGNWYDFFSGMIYSGNTRMKIFRRKENIPVFAREGAIIPLDEEPMVTKGAGLPKTLHWKIFLGKNNQFCMVEDNDNLRAITTVSIDMKEQMLYLHIADQENIQPEGRTHIFEFINKGESNQIVVDNCSTTISFPSFYKNSHVILQSEIFDRIKKSDISYYEKEKLLDIMNSEGNYGDKVNRLLHLADGHLFEMLLELLYIEQAV